MSDWQTPPPPDFLPPGGQYISNPSSKSPILWIVGGVVALGVILAVVVAGAIVAQRAGGGLRIDSLLPKSSPQTISGVKQRYTIRTPGDYRNLTSRYGTPATDIVYGNEWREVYVLVVAENGVDFDDDFTIDRYAEIILAGSKKNLKGAKVTPLADNAPANPLQLDTRDYEVAGSQDGVKVKFIFRLCKAGDTYYQVLVWTLQSRFDSHKDELAQIVSSFMPNANRPDE